MSQGVQFATPPLTPFVKRLIIVLASAFVLELVLTNFLSIPIIKYLVLWPSALGINTLWQAFTYVLVETDTTSLLVSLLFMWLMLGPIELQYGTRRLMTIAALGVVSASVAAIALALIVESPYALAGSSPITSAAIGAFCWQARRATIRWFGLIPLTGDQSLIASAGIAFLFFLQTRDHTQLVASLAALAAGMGYIEWMRKGPSMFARSSKTRRGGFRVVQGGRDSDRPKWLN